MQEGNDIVVLVGLWVLQRIRKATKIQRVIFQRRDIIASYEQKTIVEIDLA